MTTSSKLAAGQAVTSAPDGQGKGHKGRVAGLVTAAAVGLALLTGLAFRQARTPVQPADPVGVRVNPYWVYTEDVVIPGEQYPAGAASVADQFTYREDHRAVRPADASVTAEYRWDFGASNSGGTVTASCIYASAAGVPGEGCTSPTSPISADHGGDSDNLRWCSQTAGPFACAAAALAGGTERQQFLAWNLDLPTGGTMSPLSSEQMQFLAWNLQLPTGGATAFPSDQFTFREDHRASGAASETSFLPGKNRFAYYA